MASIAPPMIDKAKTRENGRFLTILNRVGFLLGLGLLLRLRWLETPIEDRGLILGIGFKYGKHGTIA
jgi:hypothetical protein